MSVLSSSTSNNQLRRVGKKCIQVNKRVDAVCDTQFRVTHSRALDFETIWRFARDISNTYLLTLFSEAEQMKIVLKKFSKKVCSKV